MKKALFFFVVTLFLNLNIADPYENDEAKGAEDCEKLDAGEGFYKCCYYETDWNTWEKKEPKKVVTL